MILSYFKPSEDSIYIYPIHDPKESTKNPPLNRVKCGTFGVLRVGLMCHITH